MSTELRGKVKRKLWDCPPCLKLNETRLMGRKAREDFKQHCREEEVGTVDAVAPDVFDKAFELDDHPVT
jgi:hypothetical protein